MTAMLSAIAYLLAFVELPVPLSPSFAKFDLSDLPALIGAFALGSLSGLLIELIKNALQLLSTSTGGIGELANFLMGSAFVVTTGTIYRQHKTKTQAWVSCAVGSLAMGIVAALANYFILLPLFESFMPLEQLIASFGEFIPFIKTKLDIVLYNALPFNILKGLAISLVTMMIYKRLTPILKGGVNMNQSERRRYLIQYLLDEEPEYKKIKIPAASGEQKQLLRGLMNVRPPRAIDAEFLAVQDEYLAETAREKGVVSLSDLSPVQDGLYLWQGDITRLQVDAIVNAANSGMTGCYQPNHTCIDNCIHTFGGVQLRLVCAELMKKQGHEEPTGQAKITPAYNLPCKYVLHTVGPIIYDRVRRQDEELLASCYRSCLGLAEENGCKSVAFCCISTGVFRFPNRRAAEIAVDTVKQFQKETNSGIEVVFNVFKEFDREIYAELLGKGLQTKNSDF